MIDIYCDIIDNYGDIAFAIKLINTYSFQKKDSHFRIFSNNREVYDMFSASLRVEAHVSYFDIWEIPHLLPNSHICNLFERQIDYNFLESFEFPIHLTNFSYFSLEPYSSTSTPGIQVIHGRTNTHKNLTVEDFAVSLLDGTGWVFSEKYFMEEIYFQEYFINKYKLPKNKKWISVFCYRETEWELKEKNFFEAFSSEYIFLSFGMQNLWQKNSLQLPFLSMQEYYSLLQHCEANIVRGENSLIPALESKKAFYWDIYKESNGAHTQKIEDFSQYLETQKYPDEIIQAQKLGNISWDYSLLTKIFTK